MQQVTKLTKFTFSMFFIVLVSVIASGAAFMSIELASVLFSWHVALILEVVIIGFGMYFFWYFRHFFQRKLQKTGK